MKTEPSRALEEVWALKEAAVQETRHIKTAREYFAHIRSHGPAIRLPRLDVKPRRVKTTG